MSNTTSATIPASRLRVRAICESAVFVAIAIILNFMRLNIMPFGGSLDLIIIPLVIIGIRWGLGWGMAAGFVFGVIKCFIGEGASYTWQSWFLDYFFAYSAVGLSGLFYHKTGKLAVAAAVVGGLGQFTFTYLSGVIIWGQWMPEEFLGMGMNSPWFYSLIYNGVYMVPNIILCAVVIGLLTVPLGKYFRGDDLV